MADFKIPEGEKFFAFMVWVALIGAALILAIDYTTKRQVLNALMELKGEVNGQSGKAGVASAANSASGVPAGNVGSVPVANAAGLETGNAAEHAPFPVRSVDQRREANGRFAAKEIDDQRGNGDPEIPGGNQPVVE